MSTTLRIRQFIANLPQALIFSTRDLLNFGTRAAVDQCLCRLVRKGNIRRLAWGLFIRNDPDVPIPSTIAIAKEKARAFGRQIITDASEAARLLGLIVSSNLTTTYATNGRSSSFKVNESRIYLQGISARKMALGDGSVGLAVRALWKLGKTACGMKEIEKATSTFDHLEHQKFKQSRHLMPFWMTNLLPA